MAGKHSASNDRRKKKDTDRPERRSRRRSKGDHASLPAWEEFSHAAASSDEQSDWVESFLFGTDADAAPDAQDDWRESTAVMAPLTFDDDGADASLDLAEETEPRRNRGLVWLAGSTGVVGITVAAVFAWLAFGATLTAPDSDHEVTSRIRDQWAAGSPTIGQDFVGIIRIPRFGKKWEFSIARGTTTDVLAHGAGWYEEGAKPGQIGNVVVSAHRVTHNAPFHDFPALRAGDKVTIETRTKIYTYKLMDDGDATTVKNDVEWPLWDVPDPDTPDAAPTHRLLTLITCAKFFHTDKRLIARAQQVDVESKST